MASQTFYPNGGKYPYAELNNIRFNGVWNSENLLSLDQYFTHFSNILIIKIKCHNEALTTTNNNGWLAAYYKYAGTPREYDSPWAISFINNYDSTTHKLDILKYYNSQNETTHVYIENVNAEDLLNKDIEFTFTLTRDTTAASYWTFSTIVINGKINNTEITPITLENVIINMEYNPYPSGGGGGASRYNALYIQNEKIGKLHSIEFDTIINNTNVALAKLVPAWYKPHHTGVRYNGVPTPVGDQITLYTKYNPLYYSDLTNTKIPKHPYFEYYNNGWWQVLAHMDQSAPVDYNLQESEIKYYNGYTNNQAIL